MGKTALDHGFGSPEGGRFNTIRRAESRRLILQLLNSCNF